MKNTSFMTDARNHQIMVLTNMLIYGLVWLKFQLNVLWIVLILLTALATQYVATKVWKLPRFEWKSAMISGLSLSILMRCPSLPISLGLAIAAILSKFIFRWNDKHIFNPTNFALALGILTGVVTIDPTQWQNGPFLAFFVLCMGIFVCNKACRTDVSLSFLLTYAVCLFAYSAWVGEDWGVPFHKLQTASLLIFTFFMISDPRSTPNSKVGRLVFGGVIAALGLYLQITYGKTGLILSLVALSITTPLLDHIFPGEKFHWKVQAINS
ncbi:MAG TPA: RnfABCDGE type electron transport complex subunit D [Bdellovibrio sp.]|nr:RnfABCDGE type electron transport complex subunit D [Bdellovibrio sp.]